MAALPGLMQVEPLQAPAPLLGALGARPAPVVLPEDTGGPAEVITHHSTDMPALPAPLHAHAMRPGPSSAHGMDATRHMNPCQLWEALWLTSSAPIKLPKPSNPAAYPPPAVLLSAESLGITLAPKQSQELQKIGQTAETACTSVKRLLNHMGKRVVSTDAAARANGDKVIASSRASDWASTQSLMLCAKHTQHVAT